MLRLDSVIFRRILRHQSSHHKESHNALLLFDKAAPIGEIDSCRQMVCGQNRASMISVGSDGLSADVQS